MNNSVILLTKDAQPYDYYPVYGNVHWDTPNIDELANKGTVFLNHYSAAPSTAMAFSAMFTGKYPYEFERKKYIPVDDVDQKTTLFGLFKEKYNKNCHIIWDKHFDSFALPYANCFGPDTIIHSINIAQKIGPHANGNAVIVDNDELVDEGLSNLYNAIQESVNDGFSFLWIHLPHVMLGRSCYGGDIDIVDRIVGHLRELFSDDCIFISADHGNMNGHKGKLCYGFDVYESAIHIPLITPRLDNKKYVNINTSNVDLIYILMHRSIPVREFVISDSAYYAQPNRKIAIIYQNFKYIYSKKKRTEELYDLSYDCDENFNILNDFYYDKDRQVYYRSNQLYYYPYWEQSRIALSILRKEKERIWRQESSFEHVYEVSKEIYRTQKKRILSLKKIHESKKENNIR